jgi:hypothetical protein
MFLMFGSPLDATLALMFLMFVLR